MMHKMISLLILLLVGLIFKPSIAGDVLEFTDADFSTRIKEHDSVLVMFYAPWCGHCKKLKPEYEKAASILSENDPPVALAKVDCTEGGKDSCNKFSVSGYPTLKIFKGGELSKDYSGPREAAGIAKYMKNQVGPSTKQLNDENSIDKFLADPEISIIGFFESDGQLKDAFTKIADSLRDKLRFGLVQNKELFSQYDVTEGIVLFRPKHLHNKFEPNTLKYDGPSTKGGIDLWLKENQHGLVDHRQRDNADEFKNPLVVAYYGVDYIKNPKGTNYWRNRILKVAQNYAKEFNFAVSSKDDFQHELNAFGYDYVPSDKPIVFARSEDNKKYAMNEEFSVDNFSAFLKKLKNGELEAYLKSEPIPESNDGPVKVAVGKNFDDIVTNSDKDSFIEFYAPWCGHCKKLTPIWEELGEKLAGEDVEIIKMDATNNDVPSPYEVRGFPTLYWAGKDSKSAPVVYNGGRDLNDFIKYVAKQSTSELKNFDRNGNTKAKLEL